MGYSPLIAETIPPTGTYQGDNKWSARPDGYRINGLNVHHHAATNTSGVTRLTTSDDPASANYIIRNSGSLIGSVDEKYRAWTTSAYANDATKITVEIQNETAGPSWRISDAAMGTLIELYADLAKRYGFPPTRDHIKGHQEYGIATACPGPYLLPRLDDVAQAAAALNDPTQGGMLSDLSKAKQEAVYDSTTAKVHDPATGRWLEPHDALRVTLAIARRTEGRIIAQKSLPVDVTVDVDADAVAEALIEQLPEPVAEAVLDRMSARLRK